MRRTMSLAKALGLISFQVQEEKAKDLLTVAVVRDYGTKAAKQGLTTCKIPIGPCSLAHTAAMQALRDQLKELTFSWHEELTKSQETTYFLKVTWTLLGELPVPKQEITDYNRASAETADL